MTFWEWLTQSPTPQMIGLPAMSGSGEVEVETHGGPGGNPGDFGGETSIPVDPITGRVVPPKEQPKLFGLEAGTLIWVVAAAFVLRGAVNVGDRSR